MSIEEMVDQAMKMAAGLRVRAINRREVGWESSDAVTPNEMDRIATTLDGLATTLAKWKNIADTREETARINHSAYEALRAEIHGRT